MKITPEQIELLKRHGFKWYKDGSTDRVEADCIADIQPASDGFTVVYNTDSVFKTSRAVVKEIEFPENPDITWIFVHWKDIQDDNRWR